MEFNMFCKSDSGNELGTTKASMNRTRKTNASAGPKKKYNEYKEFHQCELEAHICSAFMEKTGMEDTNGKWNAIKTLIHVVWLTHWVAALFPWWKSLMALDIVK